MGTQDEFEVAFTIVELIDNQQCFYVKAEYINGQIQVEEMHNWLRLVLWMGLVQLSEVGFYWSSCTLFSTNFGNVMSRNRFQILSTMIHYANNETSDPTNRLYKLGTIVEDIMVNSNYCMSPHETLCIDESMILVIDRLFFKQYLKNKRHKYGIKLFKLVCFLTTKLI